MFQFRLFKFDQRQLPPGSILDLMKAKKLCCISICVRARKPKGARSIWMINFTWGQLDCVSNDGWACDQRWPIVNCVTEADKSTHRKTLLLSHPIVCLFSGGKRTGAVLTMLEETKKRNRERGAGGGGGMILITETGKRGFLVSFKSYWSLSVYSMNIGGGGGGGGGLEVPCSISPTKNTYLLLLIPLDC